MDYLKSIRDGSTDDILCPWNYMGSSKYDDSYYGGNDGDMTNENVKYEGDEFDSGNFNYNL